MKAMWNNSAKVLSTGAEERAQKLKAFVAFAEDPGSVPSALMADPQLPVIPLPGALMPPSDL